MRGTFHRASRIACAGGLLALFALGCQAIPPDLIPFTQAMRERYDLTEDELRSVQFYSSEEIVLERVAVGGVRWIDHGKLQAREGTLVHQIVIQYATPGIVEAGSIVGPHEKRYTIEVSFEPGAPLRFVEQRSDGTYGLERQSSSSLGDWADQLVEMFQPRERLEVEFAGSQWPVVSGAQSKLMIERDALGKIQRKRRVLRGLRHPR